ncbi:hypothetical protein GGI35DRAFT_307731 [Trichoderma velutinum]
MEPKDADRMCLFFFVLIASRKKLNSSARRARGVLLEVTWEPGAATAGCVPIPAVGMPLYGSLAKTPLGPLTPLPAPAPGDRPWRAVRAVTCCTMRCPRQAAALAPPVPKVLYLIACRCNWSLCTQFPPPPARPQHTRHCLTTSFATRRDGPSVLFFPSSSPSPNCCLSWSLTLLLPPNPILLNPLSTSRHPDAQESNASSSRRLLDQQPATQTTTTTAAASALHHNVQQPSDTACIHGRAGSSSPPASAACQLPVAYPNL